MAVSGRSPPRNSAATPYFEEDVVATPEFDAPVEQNTFKWHEEGVTEYLKPYVNKYAKMGHDKDQ
jgi:hypothetical protein